MAVTWAVTNLTRDITSRRVSRGTATATPTATYTTGGDSINATTLGLHTIDFGGFKITAVRNATPLVFQPLPVVASDKQSVAIQLFGTNAVPGAAVPDPQVTAATNVDNYTFNFEAVGT